MTNQPGTGSDDGVKTYPNTRTRPEISLAVSAATSVPSTFDVTVPAGAGTIPTAAHPGKQWNAAYDIWLDYYGTEIMVWNTWTMNWRYWYGVYGGVDVTIDGVLYHAYHNASAMWFVRDVPVAAGSVDLGHVMQWAVRQGWLRSTQVINDIEYGFEVAYTGAPTTFTLNNYTLSIP